MRNQQTLGFNYLWRGLLMLKQRELLPYIVIPLLINTLFFAGLLWIGAHELGRFTYWLTGFLPAWLHWLNWLLWLLGLLAGILILVYMFSINSAGLIINR